MVVFNNQAGVAIGVNFPLTFTSTAISPVFSSGLFDGTSGTATSIVSGNVTGFLIYVSIIENPKVGTGPITVRGIAVGVSNSFCINHGTLVLTSNPQTFYFPRAFQQNVYHLVMSTTYRQRTETNQVLKDYSPLAYGSYTTSSFFAKSDINSMWDYIAAGY